MTERLDALTGLRFFAASAIVLHHLQGVLWIPAGTFEPFNLGNGVSFFFCLSGFILHYNYRDKIESIPYLQFLFVRYFRLWPAHVAALVLVLYWQAGPNLTPFVIGYMSENMTTAEILRVFFMVHSLTPDMRVYYAWNGPSWSIATELVFYCAFPILCVLAARRPVQLLIAMAAFVALYLSAAQAILYDPSIKGNAHGLGSISPLPRMLEFAAGVAVCELFLFRRHLSMKGTYVEAAAIVAMLAGIVAVRLLSQKIAPFVGPVWFHYLSAAGAFPLFCVVIAVMARSRGAVSNFLSNRAIVWLGEISFAMYLVHQPIISFVKRFMADMAVWHQLPIFIVLVILTSAAVYYAVEKPGIRLSRSLLGYRRVAAT